MSCASILLVVVAFSASFAGGEAGAQPEPPEEPSFQTPEDAEFAPGQIIVKLEEGVPERALDALNRRNNA
jgi:hypothetical protein